LAPQNLQLHAFSLQVKNQLEAMTIKTTKSEAAMTTASAAFEDENEISVIAEV
jgi:hypothetical protein